MMDLHFINLFCQSFQIAVGFKGEGKFKLKTVEPIGKILIGSTVLFFNGF